LRWFRISSRRSIIFLVIYDSLADRQVRRCWCIGCRHENRRARVSKVGHQRGSGLQRVFRREWRKGSSISGPQLLQDLREIIIPNISTTEEALVSSQGVEHEASLVDGGRGEERLDERMIRSKTRAGGSGTYVVVERSSGSREVDSVLSMSPSGP
jgi:hypothetical protein